MTPKTLMRLLARPLSGTRSGTAMAMILTASTLAFPMVAMALEGTPMSPPPRAAESAPAKSWTDWLPWKQSAQSATDPAERPAFSASNPTMVDTKSLPAGAVIRTSRGDIVVELFPQDAPVTVANFQRLASQGFYSEGNMTFHRVVPGFVIQTGDPTGTGTGGSYKKIPLEVTEHLSHTGRGILAMARSSDPNSASSQFYITIAAQPSLDGKYAVFGRVIQGLEVIDQVQQGDKVYGVTLQDVGSIVPEKGAPALDTMSYRMKKLVKPGKRNHVRAR